MASKLLAPDVFDSEVGRTTGRFCPRFPHRCPILPHSGIFESESLKQHFDQSLKAVGEFVRTSRPDDDFFFMTFSKKIIVQVEGSDWDTVDKYLRSAKFRLKSHLSPHCEAV